MATIRIQREDFDAGAEVARLSEGRRDIGAVVTFTGLCRGAESGEPIAALTLFGDPGQSFATLKDIKAQVVRVTMYWGYGPLAVAAKKPTNPTNPSPHPREVVTSCSQQTSAVVDVQEVWWLLQLRLQVQVPRWR